MNLQTPVAYIVFISVLIKSSESFLGRGTYIPPEGDVLNIYCRDFEQNQSVIWHHEEITKEAIKLVISALHQGESKLSSMQDVVSSKSSFNFWTTFGGIIDAMAATDDGENGQNPSNHFLNEKFSETQKSLAENWSKLLESTQLDDMSAARTILAISLTAIQDFYSYTNWVELGNKEILKDLGLPYFKFTNVAKPNQPTCRKCGEGVIPSESDEVNCRNTLLENVIQSGVLTSSYFLSQSSPEFPQLTIGKCVEERDNLNGSFQNSSGISKDLPSACYSPHSELHDAAAKLAVKATVNYLENFRSAIGEENFLKILGFQQTNHKFLILDASESFANEIQDLATTFRRESVEFYPLTNQSRKFSIISYSEYGVDPVQHFDDGEDVYTYLSSLELKPNSEFPKTKNYLFSAVVDGLLEAPTYASLYILTNDYPLDDKNFSKTIDYLVFNKKIYVIPIFSIPDPVSDAAIESSTDISKEFSEFSTYLESLRYFGSLAAKSGSQMLVKNAEIGDQSFEILVQSDKCEKTILKSLPFIQNARNTSFLIDSQMNDFEISVVGKTSALMMIDPFGKFYDIRDSQMDSQVMPFEVSISKKFHTIVKFANTKSLDNNFVGNWTVYINPKHSSVSLSITSCSELKPLIGFYRLDFNSLNPSLRKVDGTVAKGNADYIRVSMVGYNETSATTSIEAVSFGNCYNAEEISTEISVHKKLQRNENFIKLKSHDIPAGDFAVRVYGRMRDGSQFERQYPFCFNLEKETYDQPSLSLSIFGSINNSMANNENEGYKESKLRHLLVDDSLNDDAEFISINNQKGNIVNQKPDKVLQDSSPPSLRLRHKTSCNGFLTRDICKQNVWTATVTIWDNGRGLQRIWTDPVTTVPYIPPGIPYLDFVYSNECCQPDVTIYAEDLAANRNRLYISVGRLQKLGPGAIVGIVLGCIAFLLLLILLIVLIVWCLRRRSARKDSITLTTTRPLHESR